MYVCMSHLRALHFTFFFDLDNGTGLLEECLTDCLLTLDYIYVIMAGDLNSRTASNSQVSSINENMLIHYRRASQ